MCPTIAPEMVSQGDNVPWGRAKLGSHNVIYIYVGVLQQCLQPTYTVQALICRVTENWACYESHCLTSLPGPKILATPY